MLQFHTFIVHIYICKVASCTTDYIVYGCTQCVIAQVSATSYIPWFYTWLCSPEACNNNYQPSTKNNRNCG